MQGLRKLKSHRCQLKHPRKTVIAHVRRLRSLDASFNGKEL